LEIEVMPVGPTPGWWYIPTERGPASEVEGAGRRTAYEKAPAPYTAARTTNAIPLSRFISLLLMADICYQINILRKNVKSSVLEEIRFKVKEERGAILRPPG
jgi:hypothetical protein